MRNQIAFERFAIDRGLDTAKKVNGDYREYDTYLAFETWQASRSVAIEDCANTCEARHMGDNNREDMEALRCAAAIRAMKGE